VVREAALSGVNLFGAAESNERASGTGVTRFVRVVVERGIDAKGGDGLTYGDPSGLLRVGDRVEVPLGKGNRRAGGLVVAVGGTELLGEMSPARVKLVVGKAVEGLETRLPASLVELARWMSEYYVCPLGVVLANMMPAAVKRGTGRRVERVLQRIEGVSMPVDAGKALRTAWAAMERLEQAAWPATEAELRGLMGLKSVRGIRMLVRAGALREAERVVVRSMGGSGLLEGEERGGKASDERGHPLGEGERGSSPNVPPVEGGLRLTSEQAAAVEGVGATLGTFVPHVLFGVTGSGKTEVYLRLIDRVLARGERAIVLVPEIALTPQTAGRFVTRFGRDRVAAMHSGLTASQRNAEWRRACSGEASVVVGARSAIFAPVERLGLILVDEEHDSAYKQDSQPRYNGRDVAVKRAQLEGCPVVLGSATPSMESWWNATRGGGKYRLWRLPSRVPGMVMPRVEVVDMQEQRRLRASSGDLTQRLLGPRLEREIDATLAAGGQVILLLNRRGFAHHVACPDPKCGFVLCCQYCDASLVYHKGTELPRGGLVRCHLCQSEQVLPTLCPVCQRKLRVFGGGTQRAEEELERTFAAHGIERHKTLLRVDSDTMTTGREFASALARFGRGEIKILLGTQMIAKGLDFPNVRLVGVLDADTAAALPDFRASERTFQLVSQVAGRAGRGREPGLVIVQTWRPGDPAVRLAAEHKFEEFAELELHRRVKYGLPPRTRLVRIVCRDKDSAKSRAAAERVATALGGQGPRFMGEPAGRTPEHSHTPLPHAGGALNVRGPLEAPIARIAGYYRWVVEVTGGSAGTVQAAIGEARRRGLLRSDAKTAVDVDPVSLM
jgi:primosomal protein N' (replication factor Y)